MEGANAHVLAATLRVACMLEAAYYCRTPPPSRALQLETQRWPPAQGSVR
jgi:hypothetical protein